MLRKLSVKNFRLLRDVTIEVEPGKPIVLIGPNGSGKSSVIQVLDLLGRWADEGFVAGCRAFGGPKALLTVGQFENASVEVTTEDSWPKICTFKLRYRTDFGSHVACEYLFHSVDDESPVQYLQHDENELWLFNTERKSKDQFAPQPDAFSFEKIRVDKFYPFLTTLRRDLRQTRVYDGFLTNPIWARDSQEGQLSPFDSATISPVQYIGRRGLDLVNALYHLQQNHGDAWDELIDNFRAEFPFIQRLEFPADPAGGRIALSFRDKRYPGQRLQGHQMSEGMATYLCLLAAILCPEPATALAFDEPDRHLHPSALRRIAYLLERASEKTAVFVATHSDRFLDYLSDPAGSIRVCEPTSEGVKLRTLNRDALEAWRKNYSMQELRAQGHLDPANSDDPEA